MPVYSPCESKKLLDDPTRLDYHSLPGLCNTYCLLLLPTLLGQLFITKQ